jgi:hypothetical protein
MLNYSDHMKISIDISNSCKYFKKIEKQFQKSIIILNLLVLVKNKRLDLFTIHLEIDQLWQV